MALRRILFGGRSGDRNVSEFPFDGDALALGVAGDALAVATELRIVACQKDEPCQHTRAELVEKGTVAVVPVDLPVRCDRTQIDDAGMGAGGLVGGIELGHG